MTTPENGASLRYIASAAVRQLLPDAMVQVELAEAGFRMLREGTADVPATPEIAPRPGAFGHAMPAYLSEGDVTAMKWISGSPLNRERGLPYLSGIIVVNDSETGQPRAIMDAVEVTAARTAAVSAACAKTFARSGWDRLGIIGFGRQAKAHLSLFARLFPEVTTRVFSRSNGRTPQEPRDTTLFANSARDAVEDADVVITAIPLEEKLNPLLEAEWLSRGALVLPLDDDASLGSSVSAKAVSYYVDDLEDYAIRKAAGHFTGWRDPDGSVAAAAAGGPPLSNGITLCLNQGMGLFDALFAHAILEQADNANVGIALER